MKTLAIIITVCSLALSLRILAMTIETASLRWEGIESRKIQLERSRLLYEVCGSNGSFEGGNILCGESVKLDGEQLLEIRI